MPDKETPLTPPAPTGIGCTDLLADVRDRLEKCNARARAFKELPQILHDGDWEKFERLKTERLTEEISIMAEAIDAMKQLDALMAARRNGAKGGRPPKTITDGFGQTWAIKCPKCKRNTMEVVRPGKAQCSNCG